MGDGLCKIMQDHGHMQDHRLKVTAKDIGIRMTENVGGEGNRCVIMESLPQARQWAGYFILVTTYF